MTRDQLPLIDLNGLDPSDPERDMLARRLDDAFSTIGFCYVANLGVDRRVVDGAFEASRRFHALPDAAKRAIAMNRFHRGYMPPKTSTIITSSVAEVRKPNFSESFMLMHEVAPEAPDYGTRVQGPNQWPADVPGFREAVSAFDTAMAAACRGFTRLIARALGLAEDHLDPFFDRPTTFLRLLHYPPQPVDSAADEFGSAPHTDYGFVTVLAQDSLGGLEVRRRDGTWLPATPIDGAFVVNVGDMLARWTRGRWQSTPHRVRNLAPRDRYSCPFFFDPRLDAVIEPLPVEGAPDAGRIAPVVYGDYLMERLDRNYAYRQRP